MENTKQSTFTTKKIVLAGVFAALVFAGSWIQIPMPGETRLHLGNVMCLLSGFILGPVLGGLSAGIGSAFFDLTNPLYIRALPFTLVFKFLMAFVCGKIAWAGGAQGKKWSRNILAGVAGVLTYVLLYVGKNFVSDVYFSRMEIEAALINAKLKGTASGINALIAVVASVPLAQAIQAGLSKAKISVPGGKDKEKHSIDAGQREDSLEEKKE